MTSVEKRDRGIPASLLTNTEGNYSKPHTTNQSFLLIVIKTSKLTARDLKTCNFRFLKNVHEAFLLKPSKKVLKVLKSSNLDPTSNSRINEGTK